MSKMSKADKVAQLVDDVLDGISDDEVFESFAVCETTKKKHTKLCVIQSESESEDENVARKKVEARKVPKKFAREAEVEVAKKVPKKVVRAAEVEVAKKLPKKITKKVAKKVASEAEAEVKEPFVSDFDLMLKEKKKDRPRRRKQNEIEILNANDELIADVIQRMKAAADEDRELNKARRTAFNKMKLLSTVVAQLKKKDLQWAFIELGVLSVLTDWLAPLPDGSLPSVKIREDILTILLDYPQLDVSALKASAIAKAVMYLNKHPKETTENRVKTGQLIAGWSKIIFNADLDDREIEDYDKRKSHVLEDEEEESRKRPKVVTMQFMNRGSTKQPSRQDRLLRSIRALKKKTTYKAVKVHTSATTCPGV